MIRIGLRLSFYFENYRAYLFLVLRHRHNAANLRGERNGADPQPANHGANLRDGPRKPGG